MGSSKVQGMWTPMQVEDLDAVIALGDAIHLNYPEDPEVARERFSLYPAGCFCFNQRNATLGYIFSHPWMLGDAPPLNSLLGAIPHAADCFYLHDIALAASVKSHGAGTAGVRCVKALAKLRGFQRIAIVAVNKSEAFWSKNAFVVVDAGDLTPKLRSYDDDARYMVCSL